MEQLQVKDQERQFEEVPGTLMLAITLARQQDDNKRKDKWTALFRRAGLWGSGSTVKHAIKLLKTQKKTKSATMVYIYIYNSMDILTPIFLFHFVLPGKIGLRN